MMSSANSDDDMSHLQTDKVVPGTR